MLAEGRGLRPFWGESGGERVADSRKDCRARWLILQAGGASSHVWDQCRPEGCCCDIRCSFYLTRSPSGAWLCRAASAHAEFPRDEGLAGEQEEPLGLGSDCRCEVAGRRTVAVGAGPAGQSCSPGSDEHWLV